jgi:hypothetical protein
MKAMANHRTDNIEFKRQVAGEFLAGETLHGLSADSEESASLPFYFTSTGQIGAVGVLSSDCTGTLAPVASPRRR